jgi:glycosyltransferase involved in cell wall biosynthesis
VRTLANRSHIGTTHRERIAEKFAIVIPAHNEQEHIAEVVKLARTFAEAVVVVDDGSDDATSDEAERAGAELLRNSKPRGVGAALRLGFRRVFARGFSVAVSIDGDRAHDPAIIPSMVICHLQSKADMTIGSRLINHREPIGFPSAKEAANRFAALLLKTVTGTTVTDVASGLRVVNKTITNLPTISSGYGYVFEVLCAATAKGLIVREFPVTARYDARDIFATRRVEVLGLVRAAKKFAKSKSGMQRVSSLLRMTGSLKKVVVRMSGSEFVLHPVREYDSYLIQEQNPPFLDSTVAESVRVDL